jgi:hypothetical protein
MDLLSWRYARLNGQLLDSEIKNREALLNLEFQKISAAKFKAFFAGPDLARSRYATILERWEREFPVDQISIQYFDEIQTNPQNFIDQVTDFLGVPRFPSPGHGLNEIVLEGPRIKMPQELEKFVYELHFKDLSRLYEKKSNPWIKRWLDRQPDRLA